MNSTEVPAYGQQEQSACNGHFEATHYHPRLLFNGEGDCLAAKLRPGNVCIVKYAIHTDLNSVSSTFGRITLQVNIERRTKMALCSLW